MKELKQELVALIKHAKAQTQLNDQNELKKGGKNILIRDKSMPIIRDKSMPSEDVMDRFFEQSWTRGLKQAMRPMPTSDIYLRQPSGQFTKWMHPKHA